MVGGWRWGLVSGLDVVDIPWSGLIESAGVDVINHQYYQFATLYEMMHSCVRYCSRPVVK